MKSQCCAQSSEEVAQITGAAEADAARIYAEAHRQDPELYKFIRSMDTLEEVIGARSSLILRTDSAPFGLWSVLPLEEYDKAQTGFA